MTTPKFLQGCTLETTLNYRLALFQISEHRFGKIASIEIETGILGLAEAHGRGYTYRHFSDVKPLLRPFDDLLLPLPDGSIPALEAARMQYPLQNVMEVTRYGGHLEVLGRGLDFDQEPVHVAYIQKRDIDRRWNSAAVAYLRRHDFVVDTPENEYILLPPQKPT